MKVNAAVVEPELATFPRLAALAERIGFDAVQVGETRRDPLMPLLLAAGRTTRIQIGTAVLIAPARSPMQLAYAANDLQEYSRGRLVLGLGSQVKAHVERRFGTAFSPPVARMREFVQALRAIWDCWSRGTPLSFRGEFYQHTLMTSFFRPPAHSFGPPRVLLAAVGPKMAELAGEVSDGLILHDFTTARYLVEVLLPALREGLRKSDRSLDDIELIAPGLVVTGGSEEEYEQSAQRARQSIAFYGATPGYRPVLAVHGWADLQGELNALAVRERWDEMAALISDEILSEFAVRGESQDIARLLAKKYGSTCDTILLNVPYDRSPELWADVVDGLHGFPDTHIDGR